MKFKDYITLCKPKVVLMMAVTALVGMYLSIPTAISWKILVFGTLGIVLSGSSAAVFNHLLEHRSDAHMKRTAQRPLVKQRILPQQALWFGIFLGCLGLFTVFYFSNLLTTVLTFLTMLGYAAFYTVFLKRKTPQNIVIGGIAGAMPPLLGWTAVTGETSAFAWLLVLIIFTWTPPHFWALALYRKDDYEKADIPMLPNTHGVGITKLFILLYTILLYIVTLLPYLAQMTGLIYLISANVLGILFLSKAFILYIDRAGAMNSLYALKTFRFSIVYLLLLFIALLVDHAIGL